MIRVLASVLLAFLMAVTSQSMALTRGAAAATGQMVICNGSGTMTVYTDANGAPTTAPHICPECVASVSFSGPPVVITAPTRVLSLLVVSFTAVKVRAATKRLGPPVRAPPSIV